MKHGVIIPTACAHSMQSYAYDAARRCSRPETPVLVLFNGCDPLPVPDGVEVVRHASFVDESDLWQWCLEHAVRVGWDWCMMVHDDFEMYEPGWEAQLEEAATWRVALASWLTWDVWDEQANTSVASPGRIGVAIDSFTFGFRVDLFAARGFVCAARWGFGYGAWEPNAWALRNDYALLRIVLNCRHQWEPMNARALLKVPAPGHPEFRAQYGQNVLPARVLDAKRMAVRGRVVQVVPNELELVELSRDVRCQINFDDERVTNTGQRTSVRIALRDGA